MLPHILTLFRTKQSPFLRSEFEKLSFILLRHLKKIDMTIQTYVYTLCLSWEICMILLILLSLIIKGVGRVWVGKFWKTFMYDRNTSNIHFDCHVGFPKLAPKSHFWPFLPFLLQLYFTINFLQKKLFQSEPKWQ